MKVSQLLHAMGKDEEIIIEDEGKPISQMTVYHGDVRGIKRDDPINRMHVSRCLACDNIMIVIAKGGSNEQRAD